MIGKGGFTSTPQRRLRIMLGAQIFWLALVCVLGAWWSSLVLSQAGRIAELEKAAGMEHDIAQAFMVRTQRMVFWESGVFGLLLLASTGLLFWFYWRDVKRVRGTQAFFASMTHELRTPLTSIRLQAESIADNSSQDSIQRELVGRLLEDTLRLEGQVDRTLALARVEGGGQVFPQPLELKPWLGRLLSEWKEAYGEKIQFNFQIQDFSVMADPTALQIVMKNLLENSLRHAKREDLKISVRAEKSNPEGKIRIVFRDNGAAFRGEIRRLGEIFNKGQESRGAGVGLYLIRVLVKQMGGTSRFFADEGFGVELQLQEARADGS